MKVKATLKPGYDDLKQPGDFIWLFDASNAIIGLFFVCPCGDADCAGSVYFDTYKTDSPKWHWNGSHEAPTLTPSIRKVGGCNWHGYLTAGEFVPC